MKRRRAIPRTLAAAVVLLAGACAGEPAIRDLEGRPLGEERWQLVRADAAALQLPDPPFPVLQREAVSLPTRYLERWTIDGGHLFFEALEDAQFTPETASPAFLVRIYGDDRALAELGIVLDEAQARSRDGVTYILAHAPGRVCYLFATVFGAAPDGAGPGNKLVRGGRCSAPDRDGFEGAERELDWLLAHLRAGGDPVTR